MKMSEENYSTVLKRAFGRDEKGTLGERFIAEAAYALGLERAPEGFALVPIEPTDEMCEAAWESEGTDYVGEHLRIWQIAPAYRAMIAAAQPKEPT